MVKKSVKSCRLLKPVSVYEDESAIEVAKKLHDFQERRIFVVNRKKMPIGVISLVDINDRLVARGKDPKKTKAKEIMSYPLALVIDANEDADEAVRKMLVKDNFYCPVTEKGVLKGLLTYANIMSSYKNEKR
jgi:CBS domain-containing protein